MRAKHPRRFRVLTWLALLALCLVAVVYVGLPFVFGVAAVWPSRADVGETPPGFRDVSFATDDGVELAAWYAPSGNGRAVIVVHGAGGSRSSLEPVAAMFAQRGYGVLALDASGHGESGGTVNRLGWMGTRDVRAAVDYLLEQDPSLALAGFGSSMGGEILLGASAACPEIRAVVADGATRRSTDELRALPSERPLVRNFTARVMYASVGLLSGQEPPRPLLEEMRRSRSTGFLLIAAGDEDLEAAFSRYFAEQVGPRAQVWVVPGVAHTQARGRVQAEFDQRVLTFLDEQLAS
jgi:uncharacterized protein